MTRGVGIAKRGFGRALSRKAYAEGGYVDDSTPITSEELEGALSGVKKISENQKKYKEKSKEAIKDFSEGFKEGVKKSAKANIDISKQIIEGGKAGVKKIVEAPVKTSKTIVESIKKLEDPEFRKKAGIGQPYLGRNREEYKKGGKAKIMKGKR
jgi:hypothetical protein